MISESTQERLNALLGDLFATKAASGVEKMLISDVLDYLKGKTSVNLDKSSFMKLVDTSNLAMVKDIDGTDVWFDAASQTYRDTTDPQAAMDKNKKTAISIAKKAITK